MVEVDKNQSRATLHGLIWPLVLLSSCVSDADTFRAKADEPVDSGAGGASSSNVATDTSLASEATVVSITAAPSISSETAPEAPETSAAAVLTSGERTESSVMDAGSSLETVPMGDVPAELVGVWQRVGATSRPYDGEFGETFTRISDASVKLEVTAEGQYRFSHHTTGIAGGCDVVSRLDESSGTATLRGNVLTLSPLTRRVETQTCETDVSVVTELEPIDLEIRLTEGRTPVGGLRSFVMSAEGYGFPLTLTSLFREPNYVPEQPARPEEFVLGVNGAFADLQGAWTTSSTATDASFYDPDTDEFDFEGFDGPERWLHFNRDDYEIAVALKNVNGEGSCEVDLIYYERGIGAFEVLEDVDDLGMHFIGHVALGALESRLIVNVRECEHHDGAIRYDVDPLTSYFRWDYLAESEYPESFTLACDFPKSEWQTLLCDEESTVFVRPE